MGIKQNTYFIQSNADWPMPKANEPVLQSPGDQPQPIDGFFTALMEGEGEGAFDNNKLVSNYRVLRRREERLRLTKRSKADEAWDKYNGIYGFEEKEDWQSRKVVPKVFITVERLASVICRILEQSSDWFDIQALDEKGQIYYNLVKRLIKFFLDHDSVNFNKIFRNGVKTGLLWQNMYIMVVWEQDGEIVISEDSPLDDTTPVKDSPFLDVLVGKPSPEETELDSRVAGNVILPGKKMPRLRLQLLNPDYVYLDSTGRNRYKMWELKMTKGEALREAEVRGWDMEAVERALAKPTPAEDTTDVIAGFHETRDAQKQDRVPDYKHFQSTKISNFFGDFYDEDTGELVLENTYFVVMNDTEIVYGPVDNPSWDREDPIIAAPMIEVPFSAYGKSPLVENMDMFDLWNEFLNLMVDYFQSILFGMKEVDMDLVEDADQDLSSGFYPGRLIRTSKGGQPGQAITNVPFSDVPAGFWQFMQIFQKEVSDNTLLTDTMAGQPRQRGRVTAMEFNRRASEAGTMIDFVFDSLQDNLLGPLIRKTFHCLLQNMPQKMWKSWVETHASDIAPTDPALKQQWDSVFEQVKNWTPPERWKNLAGFFRFKVRVYSAIGDRQMEIEKGTFLLQTVAQVPGAAGHIRYDKLLRYLVRAFGWDPEEIISPDQIPLPTMAAIPGMESEIPNLMSQFGGGQEIPMSGLPQPGGQSKPSLGAPQSISTSPPFAPGAGGPGLPP